MIGLIQLTSPRKIPSKRPKIPLCITLAFDYGGLAFDDGRVAR
jgi:hypothetical protein